MKRGRPDRGGCWIVVVACNVVCHDVEVVNPRRQVGELKRSDVPDGEEGVVVEPEFIVLDARPHVGSRPREVYRGVREDGVPRGVGNADIGRDAIPRERPREDCRAVPELVGSPGLRRMKTII